jgi:hypothetical protein
VQKKIPENIRKSLGESFPVRFSFECLCILLAIACGWDTKLSAQGVTPEMVDRSIKAAVNFLRREQNENGSWAGYPHYESAQTSLCVLALLNCGLTPQDPTVDRGLKFISGISPNKTYETSLQTMAYCAANPVKYAALIRRNVEWLEAAQIKSGETTGGWSYDKSPGRSDTSNAQFAVLALWEAQRALQPIPLATMKAARDYWTSSQALPATKRELNVKTMGGWSYPGINSGEPITGSMTCAGIASMVMTEDALDSSDVRIIDGKLQCCGDEIDLTPAEIGLKWLDANASITSNPNGGYLFYYLYALERVGRLTGQRFFNNHDWYREGCEAILQRQVPANGYFSNGGGENDRTTDTALALLFLSKGKRQIVMSRVELNGDAKKDSFHRRSLQHLTGHIEQAWKRDLAWQSLTLENATVEQLLDSPILFMSGSSAFQLPDKQKKLLKDYIEQGGFVFAEAANGNGCDGKDFEISFRALMEELFQRPLVKLPISHPIWFAEASVDIDKMPSDFWLYGMEACCRTSVVFSPISLSCRWELLRPYGFPSRLPENILGECQQSTLIGVNVATYATGRELKQKLDAVDVIKETATTFENPRGVTQVPRLAHNGGAEDTPRAVPHLMDLLVRELPSRVSNVSPLLLPSSQELSQHSVAYLSGRRSFQWTDAERIALREYFKNGGMVIGDAVCGNADFTKSVREEISAIVPEATWKTVEPNHSMMTDEYQGFDIRRVTINRPTAENGQAIQIQKYEGTPAIEMLVWNGHPIVVFSPYDLSCALESRQSSQCLGYPRDDAAKIAINMILYAIMHDREATSEPK